MIRGTTPDYLLTIPGYDLTECTIYVTVKQSLQLVTLDNERLSVSLEDEATYISFRLTQSETLKFKPGDAEIQVRFIDSDGLALATETGHIQIMPVLLEKVIEYDEPGTD